MTIPGKWRRIGVGVALCVVLTSTGCGVEDVGAPGPTSPELLAPLRPAPPAVHVVLSKDNPFSEELGTLKTVRSLGDSEAAAWKELERLDRSDDPDGLRTAHLLEYLILVLLLRGDLVSHDILGLAERHHDIKERRLGAEDRATIKAAALRGFVLEQIGDYPGAREVYEMGLEGSRRENRRRSRRLASLLVRVGDHRSALRVLSGLLQDSAPMGGGVLAGLGDYASARMVLDAAIRKYDIVEGEPAAWTLHNYAVALAGQGEIGEALTFAERAAFVASTTWGPETPITSELRLTQAVLLHAEGQVAEAKRILEGTLVNQERRLGPEHPSVAVTLLALANLLAFEGELEAAGELFERSRVLHDRLGPDFFSTHFFVASLARYRWLTADIDAALSLSLEAEQLARHRFRAVAPGLSQREALLFGSRLASGLDVSQSLLVTHPDSLADRAFDVWSELARSRARVHDEIAERHGIASVEGRDEVSRHRLELARQREKVARHVLRFVESEAAACQDERLRIAQLEKKGAERLFAESTAKHRPVSAEHTVDLGEIFDRLPAKSALIAYARYGVASQAPEHGAYVAYVRPTSEDAIRVVDLGDAATIDRLVHDWQEEVARDPRMDPGGVAAAEQSYLDAAKRLRRAVWDPVAAVAGNPDRAFIVPAGRLFTVSFATLATSSNEYLLGTGPAFRYLSAERELARERPEAGSRGIMIVGAPDFGERDGTEVDGAVERGGTPRRFESLPGAEREARSLEALWSTRRSDEEVLVLTGTQANEGQFREAAGRHGILHVATHGFTMTPRCPELQGSSNAMFLAGLALAGANDRHGQSESDTGADGMLTAEEILSLDFSGVGTVVLSGCQTGSGVLAEGEGILGLRRAFEIAGARSVVVSLWPVGDEDARVWMEAMYRELLAGRSTASAVDEASLELLDQAQADDRVEHPYTWGPFVATGFSAY